MGCRDGLILAEGGRIWCGNLLCPVPDAAAQILDDAEAEHVVTFTADGFTIRHPLRERLDDALMRCELHAFLAGLGTPPFGPGRYRAKWQREADGPLQVGWDWEKLDPT